MSRTQKVAAAIGFVVVFLAGAYFLPALAELLVIGAVLSGITVLDSSNDSHIGVEVLKQAPALGVVLAAVLVGAAFFLPAYGELLAIGAFISALVTLE